MNLYLRLIWTLIRASRRDSITSDYLYNEVSTTIYPNDLDLNLHVNNGRYLTLCDLGRIDLFIRSGLLRVMYKEKWIPVVAAVTMTFIKPLHVFNRIRIVSHVTHWDEKYFHATHTIYRGDVVVAEGTSKSLVVSRRTGKVSPAEVVETVNRSWDEKGA